MEGERSAEQHPVAWLLWLAAAAAPSLVTRNPIYLGLALLGAGLVYGALAQARPAARAWATFVRFGAFMWLLTVPFTLLTSHQGRLVFARLPAHWPIIGGPLTGEALLYGIGSGLALITLLVAFAAFNLAVDQARLLRLAPAFVYQAGVAAAIAVAFVPQMVAAWESVREAQMLRGHRVRGVRDLLPLLMPLLLTALERAVQLAESMEARGFGRPVAPVSLARRRVQLLALLSGLVGMGAGLAGTQLGTAAAGWGIVGVSGLLAAGWSLADQGRQIQRTHYRRWRWERWDTAAAAWMVLLLAVWALVLATQPDWLFYYPYPPRSPWPEFRPVVGALIACAPLPALFLPAERGVEGKSE